MKRLSDFASQFPNNETILTTVAKIIYYTEEESKIMVSVSGGSDSDILIDLFERVGYAPGQVVYVWFDTGLEYEATKRHLVYLENQYGVEIQRHRAKVPVPLAVKKYGVPFISKHISQMIFEIQQHKFDFSSDGDLNYNVLMKKYPKTKSSLDWWCGKKPQKYSIFAASGLKEFLMLNPPLKISHLCCKGAKKDVSKEAERLYGAELVITGERRAEGGARATSTCFAARKNAPPKFKPIFYWSDADKRQYEEHFGIVHSDCYTVYGMKRTGCAGCPFNSKFDQELEIVKVYEPKLYKAVCSIFGASYEYTRRYREFRESFKREKRRGWQISMFDRWDEM